MICRLLLLMCLASAVRGQTLDTHPVRLDGEGKLLSWVTPQDRAFGHVSRLSADFIKARMLGPNDPGAGMPVIYLCADYHPVTFLAGASPNNPAGKNAMLADAMMLYYAYSGDTGVLEAVKALLDYQLTANGSTPASYVWGNVPWSDGGGRNPIYGTGGADGVGSLEPDKVGELGFHGYLRFYQITGLTRYRDAAIACADALAANVRPGNATQSPWPFRVKAQTGALNPIPEDYCSHVVAPIRLFDELIRLNLGNVTAYQSARTTAWNWMMTYPMVTNVWSKYFEDVPPDPTTNNRTQYLPGQTARYFLERPDLNPNWQTHSAGLIAWIENAFGGDDGGDPGLAYGARTISEQNAYAYKMASHTSRFGAICALLAEKTGDAALKDKAFRSLNWSTYMARTNGVVIEGPAEYLQSSDCWFTDGHGDFIRHFILAMGAFPEWAPASESHLLRSTSVVKSITYAPGSITYSTFDAASTETLRLAGAVLSVTADGVPLSARADLTAQGYVIGNGGALRVRHDAGTEIVITYDPAQVPPTVTLSTSANLVAPANVTLVASAIHPNGITKVDFFEGSNWLAEDTSAPFEFVWRNVPVGTFPISARATASNGLTATDSTSVTVASTTASSSVGNPSEGNSTDFITDSSGAYINACRFVAPADQQLTIVRAKVSAIAGKYQCAIYADSAGNPAALLRATNERTPSATGWETFTLSSPLDATAGTAYWLAIWSNDTSARIHTDSGGGTLRYGAYPYGTWPNPVNLTAGAGMNYCIYATGPGKAAFQQWKENNGLPPTLAPDSDDDGDGIPLLAEYALGTEPSAVSIGSPMGATLEDGYLTLTYSRNKAALDVIVRAEVSGDLVHWSHLPAAVQQSWQFLDGTTEQSITARDLTPNAPGLRRFIRLHVTLP